MTNAEVEDALLRAIERLAEAVSSAPPERAVYIAGLLQLVSRLRTDLIYRRGARLKQLGDQDIERLMHLLRRAEAAELTHPDVRSIERELAELTTK